MRYDWILRCLLPGGLLLICAGASTAGIPAAAAVTRFETRFSSITELENPASSYPRGRTLRAYVTVPQMPRPGMPVVVMNHGSGGPYSSDRNVALGRLSEIYTKWSALLAQLGYVTVMIDGYTTRGFSRDDQVIRCHDAQGVPPPGPLRACTPEEIATGWRDERSYRIDGEALLTATECGNPCVSNAPQRAYDVNWGADHLRSAEFARQLREASGPLASVDPQRFYVFGHSDGGITTLAALFHGHSDGEHLPPRDPATDAAYPKAGRFQAGVSFYPGCSMHGAFRDAARRSFYYPSVPLLILHGNADDLYRDPEDEAGACESRISIARQLLAQRGLSTLFEMVTYTAVGRRSSGDRHGVRHGFDQAYWDDVQDVDSWLVPEHMAKVNADAVLLEFFSRHPGAGVVSTRLRPGSILYQPYYFPSLPPVWQVDSLQPLRIDRNAVDVDLTTWIHNPYFYDVPSNPDNSGLTVPSDFALAMRVEDLPPGLSFDPGSLRLSGALPLSQGPVALWVDAHNSGGHYAQQILLADEGDVLLGAGYRLDTANGVMAESGTLEVDLDLYAHPVPARVPLAIVRVVDALPAGAATLVGGKLRIDPARFAALPATFAVELSAADEVRQERIVVERVERDGHPVLMRARFESRYAALLELPYPGQEYNAGSPTSGDGFGYDPADGGVPVAPPVAPPLAPAIFRHGFEDATP
jgi:dienelactone hydrolase